MGAVLNKKKLGFVSAALSFPFQKCNFSPEEFSDGPRGGGGGAEGAGGGGGGSSGGHIVAFRTT